MESNRPFTPHQAPVHDIRALPVLPPTKLIGRDKVAAALYPALKAGGAFLIAGGAGMGKTALAAVLATGYIASKRGGVLWLDVLEDDARTLVARVGRAFGVDTYAPYAGGSTVRASQARARLMQSRPLIVLDGIVDLDAAYEFIQACAAEVPVLITYDSPPSEDSRWTSAHLAPLSQTERVDMFRHYAGSPAADPNDDLFGLGKIIGGVPLTLELFGRYAAAEKLSPGEIVASLPTTTGEDTLGTILGMIFKRLPAPAQGVIMAMSITFAGGAGVEVVSGLTKIVPEQTLSLLRLLVGRGLLRESTLYRQPYFTIHESVARYFQGMLRGYGRLEGLEGRMLQVMAGYVDRHAKESPSDHDALVVELPNILGAGAVFTDKSDHDALGHLIVALEVKAGNFLSVRGFRPEIDQLKQLVALIQPTTPTPIPLPVPTSPTEMPQTALPPAPKQPHFLEPEPSPDDSQATPPLPLNLFNTGIKTPTPKVETQPIQKLPPPLDLAPTLAGDQALPDLPPTPADFVPAHAERDPLPLTLDEVDTEPLTLAPLGEAPAQEDSPPPVEEVTLDSLQEALAAAANDPAREAAVLMRLGAFARLEMENDADATNYYADALSHYEQLKDAAGEADALEQLASLCRFRDYKKMDDYATRGIAAARKAGDKPRTARLIMMQGMAKAATGGDEIQVYTNVVEQLRATEQWDSIGQGLARLGMAYQDAKKHQEAILMLEQALTIFHREGLENDEAFYTGQIAANHEALRAWTQAQSYYERALFLNREQGDTHNESVNLVGLARVRYFQNDRSEAVANYSRAIHLVYEQNPTVKLRLGEYARELGRLLLDDVQTLSQAAEFLKEAVEANDRDTLAKGLLERAETRIKRIAAAGTALPQATTNREFAAKAYVG